MFQIPEDVVSWISRNFSAAEAPVALEHLQAAVIHTGEPPGTRLLRCAAVASRGRLELLDELIRQLLQDWRDVIVAGEYALTDGKLVRLRDLNQPIPPKL